VSGNVSDATKSVGGDVADAAKGSGEDEDDTTSRGSAGDAP